MKSDQSNVRPVRGFSADAIRALVGQRHHGGDTVYVPVLRHIRLVDKVKGSAQ